MGWQGSYKRLQLKTWQWWVPSDKHFVSDEFSTRMVADVTLGAYLCLDLRVQQIA